MHSTLWHRAVHSSKGSQPVVRVTESPRSTILMMPDPLGQLGQQRIAVHSHTCAEGSPLQVARCLFRLGDSARQLPCNQDSSKAAGAELAKPDIVCSSCLLHLPVPMEPTSQASRPGNPIVP